MRRLPALIVVGLCVAANAQTRFATPPAGAGAIAPFLTQDRVGVRLSWLEPADDERTTWRLRSSRYVFPNWSEPRTVIERNDFFANWADVPSIVRSRSGALVAHWLQKSGEGTYAYDAMIARSTDDGITWTVVGPLHDDGTQTEHGFVSLAPAERGVYAFWLDGREMAATPDGHGHGHGSGDMTLRAAVITDRIGPSVVLDPRVCECCSTSAVMTAAGPLVVYRDRSEDEVRDISVVRHTPAGWTAPKRLASDDWRIAACPVNGPVVDRRDGLVVVAWYTGAGPGTGAVKAAFSRDGGATFGDAVIVDDTDPMGRVWVVVEPSGTAVISWLDTTLDGGMIMLRRIAADGRLGAPTRVAEAGTSRAAGFPRLARARDQWLVVWTDDDKPSKLQGVAIPNLEIPSVRRP